MPIDPNGGQIEKIEDGGPYRSALVIVPDDDRDLPVIPRAIDVPPVFDLIDQPEGPPVAVLSPRRYRYAIRMQLQNGEVITVETHSDSGPLPYSPRKVFASGTTSGDIRLLW